VGSRLLQPAEDEGRRRGCATSLTNALAGDAVTAMAPLPVEAHEITVSQR
jgi:hypothetical protein